LRKRKKKGKKSRKSHFPHFLSLNNSQLAKLAVNDSIITDAGFDIIDYDLALKYFNFEEILNWWELTIDFSELEENELETWDNLLPPDVYSLQHEELLKIIQQLISHFEFLPKKIDIATARAFLDSQYKWVKILNISDRYDSLDYIDMYEAEAIKLGLFMKQELGDKELLIINDNKHAVAHVSGHRFYTCEWNDDEMEKSSDILWAPRKIVELADKLTVYEATRIFSPDDDLDFFEDEDWDLENE